MGKDIIKIEILFKFKGISEKLVVHIHKSRDVKDLYEKAEQWLNERFHYDTKKSYFRLTYFN